MEPETDFYVTLSSDSKSHYTKNDNNLFKIKLSTPYKLTGKWKVALTQIIYPFNWTNLVQSDAKLSIIHTLRDGAEQLLNISPDDDDGKAIKYYLNDTKNEVKNMTSWIKTDINLKDGYYENAAAIAEHFVKMFKLKTTGTVNTILPFEYVSNNHGDMVTFIGPLSFFFEDANK